MRRFFARITVPDEGSSCPIRMRHKVVLPIPLGPTSASRAPFATEKVTPEKRSSAPKDLERELTVISDIVKSQMPPNYKSTPILASPDSLFIPCKIIFFLWNLGKRPHGRWVI